MNYRVSAFLLAFALTVPAALLARADTPALPSMATADQATTSKLVYGLLSDSRYAYRPRPLDAATSQDVFKRYLESLDGGKQFFTREDVERFAPLAAGTGDAIRTGELDPAFQVFAVYRQRVTERVAYARTLLKQEPDFTLDERFEYDRKDAPWDNATALDELWRKSVKNDWLRLKLAGKPAADIRKTLDKRYERLLKGINEWKNEDVFSIFLNAYT